MSITLEQFYCVHDFDENYKCKKCEKTDYNDLYFKKHFKFDENYKCKKCEKTDYNDLYFKKHFKSNLIEIINKKIAVNCDTFEKSIFFQENVCSSYSKNNINEVNFSWHLSGINTCYDLNNKDGIISFANSEYYLYYDYKVISYNTFINIHLIKSFCYQNNIFFDIYKIEDLFEIMKNKKEKEQIKKNKNKLNKIDYGFSF